LLAFLFVKLSGERVEDGKWGFLSMHGKGKPIFYYLVLPFPAVSACCACRRDKDDEEAKKRLQERLETALGGRI
jgi:hypothetical protein